MIESVCLPSLSATIGDPVWVCRGDSGFLLRGAGVAGGCLPISSAESKNGGIDDGFADVGLD